MITKLTKNQVKTDCQWIHNMELLDLLLLMVWKMNLAALWFDGRLAAFVMMGAALVMVPVVWRWGPTVTIITVVPITLIVKETTMISPVSKPGVTPWMSVPQVI